MSTKSPAMELPINIYVSKTLNYLIYNDENNYYLNISGSTEEIK